MKYIFAALVTFLLILNCTKTETEAVSTDETIDYPDQESWNTTMTISNDGNRVGVVQAGHLQKFSTKRMTFISDGLKVDFYNALGQHTSILTAEGGKVEDTEQDMIAYGNVVVVSDSGMTLYTDTLKWDNKNQKIISEIPVKITSATDTLYGDSFISDPSLENYEITNSRGTGSELFIKRD